MQTIVCYVENKPGVLNRVASLTRRLAINIDSLTVGPTENEEIARMTICAHTDENGARRLEASLEKLVDVLARGKYFGPLDARARPGADQSCRGSHEPASPDGTGESVSRARGGCLPESVIVEVSDTTEKIDGLLEVLRPFGVLEMGRTGRIAMTKGSDVLRPPTGATNHSKHKDTAPASS